MFCIVTQEAEVVWDRFAALGTGVVRRTGHWGRLEFVGAKEVRRHRQGTLGDWSVRSECWMAELNTQQVTLDFRLGRAQM